MTTTPPEQPSDQSISDLLDFLDSAETFDNEGRHVVTINGKSTAHKPRLCRVEICGRESGTSRDQR